MGVFSGNAEWEDSVGMPFGSTEVECPVGVPIRRADRESQVGVPSGTTEWETPRGVRSGSTKWELCASGYFFMHDEQKYDVAMCCFCSSRVNEIPNYCTSVALFYFVDMIPAMIVGPSPALSCITIECEVLAIPSSIKIVWLTISCSPLRVLGECCARSAHTVQSLVRLQILEP